jgi:hypothetical protein
MSINGLNSGSTGSWSQFVSLKEAASKRNFGQNVKAQAETANAGGTKFSEILSSKGGADVYLNPAAVKTFSDTLASVQAKDMPAKGRLFDVLV